MPIIALKLDVLENIKRECKLSEVALAAKINIDTSMLWRVKTGRNNPGHEFIAKVLYAFPELKFEDLFFLKYPSHECNTPTKKQAS